MTNAYDECGEGYPIILLHGFPFNRSMWRGQIDFLSARGYRVVAPDLRGLGQNVAQTSASENHRMKSVPVAGMEEMARDTAALMDRLKIESAVICGLSMGCYVAFEFRHLFPGRVKALVLCGARAAGPDEAEKGSREAQAQRVLNEGMDSTADSISRSLLAEATVKEKPDVVSRVAEMVLQTDPRGAAAAQRGMAARRDYANDLPNIRVPTLIIAGSDDGVRTPEDAEFIQRGIIGSQLVVVDDAGHLMNMEQPDVFNQAMLDFFVKIGSLIH